MSVVLFHEIDGALIPSEDGRLLASPRFREEAADWADRHEMSADSVVIVGLGSGHHVRAWLEAHPDSRAIVIDSRPSLIRPFRKANPELKARCEIVIVESPEALVAHEVMRTVAESLCPVFLFAPAAGAREKMFHEFFAMLTGRNPRGLRFFLERFGFDGEMTVESVGEGRLLTIKDLGLMIDTTHEGHPQASAVRVLRELLI